MNKLPDHPIIRSLERTGYPPGPEPRAVYFCTMCCEMIYEGEFYYDVNGLPICEDGVKGCLRTAEFD